MKILDCDIATIEALHDLLLDNHGYSLEHKTLERARKLTSKMYKDVGKENKKQKLGTNEEHQLSLFDGIELQLSRRTFSNGELLFILNAITHSRSFTTVLSVLSNKA